MIVSMDLVIVTNSCLSKEPRPGKRQRNYSK